MKKCKLTKEEREQVWSGGCHFYDPGYMLMDVIKIVLLIIFILMK